MKAIIVSFLAILFWTLIGHLFSSFTISVTAFYLPIIFISISVTIGKNINKYVYIGFCFALILFNDYLFRIYGGGIHDDAGRGICEIVFYLTLIISTPILLFIKIIDCINRNEANFTKRIFLDVLFVLALSSITFIFFRRFNISI